MRSAKRFLTVLAMLLLCLTLMAVSAFAAEDAVTVRTKVPADWDTPYLYCWNGDGEGAAWPGEPMTQQNGWWVGQMSGQYDNIIINNGSNIQQTSDLELGGLVSEDVWVLVIDEAIFEKNGLYVYSYEPSAEEIERVESIVSFSGNGEVSWILYRSGLVHIWGTGAMDAEFPWGKYGDTIVEVKIEEGITALGDNLFNGCTNLTVLHIPASLTSVGDYAFYGCEHIPHIFYEGTREDFDRIVWGVGNTFSTYVHAMEFYVAGVPELCGSEWNANDPENKMTLGADGFFTKVYENVAPVSTN